MACGIIRAAIGFKVASFACSGDHAGGASIAKKSSGLSGLIAIMHGHRQRHGTSDRRHGGNNGGKMRVSWSSQGCCTTCNIADVPMPQRSLRRSSNACRSGGRFASRSHGTVDISGSARSVADTMPPYGLLSRAAERARTIWLIEKQKHMRGYG